MSRKGERTPWSDSELSRAARRAAKHGHTAYAVCVCGNANSFTFDTDSMTGSSYAICSTCQRRHPFQRAWRDNALGMNFGSWWSQRLAPGFVVEP